MAESKSQKRLSVLASQICAASAPKGSSFNDVVICAATRTPICKAKRGAFKDASPEEFLVPVLQRVLKDARVDAAMVGDVVVGTVLAPGAVGATQARIACLLAGMPVHVPVRTVNRQCSSSLQAIADVAAAIQSGVYEIGIAAGMESMSQYSMSFDGVMNDKVCGLSSKNSKSDMFFADEHLAACITRAQQVMDHPLARGCYHTMGQTSEEVAQRFGISREDQDRFAVASHIKAAAAQTGGLFLNEITSVTIDGITTSQDEGIRPDTSFSGLQKLKPAFSADGSTTAGNSSQISDGAAAVLLASRATATRLKLPVIATLESFAVVGVEPAVMGVGPVAAIPEALKRACLGMSDIDVIELNEAFASQALHCIRALQIDDKKVNPKGGAIALGHPLGVTGARAAASLIHELSRRKVPRDQYGIVSMCIGSGMGAAAVFKVAHATS